LPDLLRSGRRFGAAVGVSLLEFPQLRHTRLKFTNGRLAVVTADDRTRFEPMPDHALGPRPIGDGAAVFGKRRICPSSRQQSDKGKDGSTEACSERDESLKHARVFGHALSPGTLDVGSLNRPGRRATGRHFKAQ
jgi:hypothetical protein